jgi:hypothetical protein
MGISIHFFQKTFQRFRHPAQRALFVQSPHLLADIRRRAHLQFLRQPDLRLALAMLPAADPAAFS